MQKFCHSLKNNVSADERKNRSKDEVIRRCQYGMTKANQQFNDNESLAADNVGLQVNNKIKK